MTGDLCRNLWTTNVFLYKFHISHGYHHLDNDNNHLKYFGFSWKIDSKISYFMLTVLPFSLSSAPFIFIKVMRCLVKILEKGRDKKFEYILTTVLEPPPSLDLVLEETKSDRNSLTQCGFIINLEKSVWQSYLAGNKNKSDTFSLYHT